jgi:Transposase DDE domain
MRSIQIAEPNPSTESLADFRSGFHACWTRWADAGFELCEAMLCAPGPVSSIPALSLEPVFRRSHGSLYKALTHGEIDAEAMRDLLATNRPPRWPLVFAVDESTWARCDAETSPERGSYYSASKHSAGQPIVAGWSYQWITQLDWANDSWTAPMDAVRLRPDTDTVTTTAAQITDLVARVDTAGETGHAPTFVFDAGYDPIALTHELADTPAVLVTRIRDDRVFYTAPEPTEPGAIGRPRRHGQRRECTNPQTWPQPDYDSTTIDDRYGTVHVTAWHNLHPKLGRRGHWKHFDAPPIVSGTVIRVDVQHLPKPTSRTKKTLWLWVAGGAGEEPDIEVCWRAYLRRFDIEHTFRFVKNTLGWTTPSVRTPEQADTWTWLIIAAYTQLRLARDLVEDHRLPWERHAKPGKLTPARVRRAFRRTAPTLGTPARPPKPQQSRTRTPQRQPHRATNPLPRHQKSRLTTRPRFKRKLRPSTSIFFARNCQTTLSTALRSATTSRTASTLPSSRRTRAPRTSPRLARSSRSTCMTTSSRTRRSSVTSSPSWTRAPRSRSTPSCRAASSSRPPSATTTPIGQSRSRRVRSSTCTSSPRRRALSRPCSSTASRTRRSSAPGSSSRTSTRSFEGQVKYDVADSYSKLMELVAG